MGKTMKGESSKAGKPEQAGQKPKPRPKIRKETAKKEL